MLSWKQSRKCNKKKFIAIAEVAQNGNLINGSWIGTEFIILLVVEKWKFKEFHKKRRFQHIYNNWIFFRNQKFYRIIKFSTAQRPKREGKSPIVKRVCKLRSLLLMKYSNVIKTSSSIHQVRFERKVQPEELKIRSSLLMMRLRIPRLRGEEKMTTVLSNIKYR